MKLYEIKDTYLAFMEAVESGKSPRKQSPTRSQELRETSPTRQTISHA